LVLELHQTDLLVEGSKSRLLTWLREPWSQLPADRTGRPEAVTGAALLDPEGKGEFVSAGIIS